MATATQEMPAFHIVTGNSRSVFRSSSRGGISQEDTQANETTPRYSIHHSGQSHAASCSSSSSTGKTMLLDPYLDPSTSSSCSSSSELTLAACGDSIASSHTFMKGHGTFVSPSSSAILSSLHGIVQRTNKLVSVSAVRTRYSAEVGDLVVGRILEVTPKKWKVDIHSRSDASLLLSSINLPGGVQRRKLESDELEMRSFFQEGDLLVAEVQTVYTDGSVGLHTRSLRYGKLKNGIMVTVQPVLIQRLKSHFLSLDHHTNIDITLGLNGYVWISQRFHQDTIGDGDGIDDSTYSDINQKVDGFTRSRISRVARILELLDQASIRISKHIIVKAFLFSLQASCSSDQKVVLPAMDSDFEHILIQQVSQWAIMGTDGEEIQ